MRVIVGALGSVLLGMAALMLFNGVWVGLAGEFVFVLLLLFIMSRLTLGYEATPDPLMEVRPSPLVDAPAVPLSVWDGIEVGTKADGSRLAVSLNDGSTLLAGQTRSGKTVFMNNLIAACAMDPSVRLAMFDGKGTLTFRRYQDIAKVDRSADPAELLKFLTELDREVERRYEMLADLGEEKLSREIYSSSMPLFVVFIDEVGNYTVTYPNKKIGQSVVHMLSSVAAKGAGAGVLLILANQRVSVEFIPAKIRANISQRISFRVADRIENDMILGPGSAKRGYDASSIPRGVEHRGIGFADIDGHKPVKFRADLIEYKDTLAIAAKAARVRGAVEPSLPPTVEPELTEDVDDVLETDVLVAERDVTEDIRSVWKLDEERLHNSVILDRLKAQHPEYYGEWSAQLFGRQLREAGLAKFKRQFTEGDRVNHWGLYASALFAGDDGKDSKTERREREQAALDMLTDHERMLYEAKLAEIQRASACSFCHGMLGPDNPATADHLIPLNAGGTSHAWNLVPACRSCNSSKRDKPVAEWLATREAS